MTKQDRGKDIDSRLQITVFEQHLDPIIPGVFLHARQI
jgi:hypothetical protein